MFSRPALVRTIPKLRSRIARYRAKGETIALVPTMGALHDGHLHLVREARKRCRNVVTSIFVNPAQFAPTEDLARYPRDEAGDVAKLAGVDCDLVWAPGKDVMYPESFATRIVPGGAAEGLESDFRPGFFSGVATVCCKLFTQVAPDIALFGEKDYQQLCVVRQLVRDLDLPLEIVGVPTVREADGLAMSSRNRYLSPEERRIAPKMHEALASAAEWLVHGATVTEAPERAREAMTAAGFKVDYIALREADTLWEVAVTERRPLRLLAAAWLGKTRLIDNVPVIPR